MAPPPFTPSPDLGKLIGVNGLGLMVWLVAKAQETYDVPGGWAVSGSAKDLAAELGWGHSRWAAETKALHAAGLIEIAPGMRLGRGGGSTPNRYFLTHSPDLHTPSGPVGGSRFRESYFRHVDNGHAHSDTPQTSGDNVIHRDRHLIAAPSPTNTVNSAPPAAPNGPLDGSESLLPSNPSASVVEGLQQQQDVGGPESNTSTTSAHAPQFVMAALARIDWIGPPPAVDDWQLLASVCLHLDAQRERFSNPPGFLFNLVKQGGLTVFAQNERLPAARHDEPSVAAMSFAEYTARCIDNPGWAHMVDVETARRAQVLGVEVSMLLKRTVALEIPVNSARQAEA